MQGSSGATTLLFTDIEGSTRLWEQDGEGMSRALAAHDAASRTAVEDNHGIVVKMTGDGMYAAFDQAADALNATVSLQQALDALESNSGFQLRVRAGLHLGMVERRDDDLFGSAVNRAARIMKAAHGGQILVSQAVVDKVGDRLPRWSRCAISARVRLRDLATSERVYQLVHPKLREDFPALRSLEAIPNNLPAAGHVVHRPRARAVRSQDAARKHPPAHPARHGRAGQDPVVAADRRRRRSRNIPTAYGSSTSRRSRIRRWSRTSPHRSSACGRNPASRCCRRCALTSKNTSCC